MSNPYFRLAINRAALLLGRPGRLLTLAIQLSSRAKSINFSKANFKEKLFLLGRLLRAFASGRYRVIPIRSILLVTAAIIYFMNPLDLIPDAVIGLGFTDDLAILTGVYKLLGNELEKFRDWEINQVSGNR